MRQRRKLSPAICARQILAARQLCWSGRAEAAKTFMRLLFVKLKHIGDSLLLTPTLTAVRANYPQAQIWVVVRKGCEGIMAGCPALDKLFTAAPPEAANRSWSNWWRDFQTIRELRRQRFDYAFELSDGDRGRFVCWLSGARARCTNAAIRPLSWWWRRLFTHVSDFDWRDRHRAEKDFYTVNDALPLKGEVPAMTFLRERTARWEPARVFSDYAVIHPGTRWKRKRWPRENWIETGRYLLTRFPRVIISTGPDPEEATRGAELRAALGGNALCTEGKTSWAELAGLLHGARLFVGVDTAAMHLAAACGCPTVAILGPTVVNQWRPWRTEHRVVTPGAGQANQSTSVDERELIRLVTSRDVIQACAELVNASAPSASGPAG